MGSDSIARVNVLNVSNRNLFPRLALASILALSLLLLAFRAGMAAELVMDRSWWNNTVPADSRVWVISGMVDAFGAGYSEGVGEEDVRLVREAGAVLPASGVAALNDMIYRKDANGYYESTDNGPTFSRTFGFYESAVSDFYETHPTANTSVGWVMGCLTDHPAMSCDKIASFHR